MRAAIVWLFVVAFACAAATFIENDYGSQAARAAVYNNRIFEILLFLFCVSLVGSMVRFGMFHKEKTAVFVFHAAILAILIGAFITRYFGYEGYMHLREGQTSAEILSADPYLAVSSSGLNASWRLPLSPIASSDRSFSANLGGGAPVTIETKSYYPRAKEAVVEVENDGAAYIAFALFYGEKPIGAELFEGQYFENNGVIFYFGDFEDINFTQPTIAIGMQDNQLVIRSYVDMTRFDRQTGEQISLRAHSAHPFDLNVSYATNDGIGIALLKHFLSADKKVVEAAPNEDGLAAIIVDVSHKDEHKEVALLGGARMSGERAEVELSGRKFVLSFGSETIELPFSLKLDRFIVGRYPGSTVPSSYESQVTLIDEERGLNEPRRIYMNNILTHRQFRFYQASYDTWDERGTLLSVSNDPGVWLTYIGYALLTFGFFIAFFSPKSRFRTLAEQIEKSRRMKSFAPALVALILLGGALELKADETDTVSNANEAIVDIRSDEVNQSVRAVDTNRTVQSVRSVDINQSVSIDSNQTVRSADTNRTVQSVRSTDANQTARSTDTNRTVRSVRSVDTNRTIRVVDSNRSIPVEVNQSVRAVDTNRTVRSVRSTDANQTARSTDTNRTFRPAQETNRSAPAVVRPAKQEAGQTTLDKKETNATSDETNRSAPASVRGDETNVTTTRVKGIVDLDHAKRFGSLLVQDANGRIKPIDTLARETLSKISRQNEFSALSATQVFLGMLSVPEGWLSVKMIRVNHPEIGPKLNLEYGVKYVSFFDIAALDSDGALVYRLADETALAKIVPDSQKTQLDKELLKLHERYIVAYMVYVKDLLRIFPVRHDPSFTWNSPIQMRNLAKLSPSEAEETNRTLSAYLDELRKAQISDEWNNADLALDKLRAYQETYGVAVMPSETRVKAELLLNAIKPFSVLLYAYFLLGTFLLIWAFVRSLAPNLLKKRGFYISLALVGATALSFAFHTIALALRWYVSGHAPWSNGYESIIYVAWSALFAGLFFARRSIFALPAATLIGAFALITALIAEYDPQITTLAPVLKSHWLTIHVSVISASYGFLGMSMLLGLTSLALFAFRAPRKVKIDEAIAELRRINEMAMMVGLALLTIGNIFGAIWANESWGRYWSWDPKETWTLISILIYAAILHFRFVPTLKSAFVFSFSSAFAFASILMTYFGVNFYLSGMHSYASGDAPPVSIWFYVVITFFFSLSILAWNKSDGRYPLDCK
jgi:cytochrome c-type biogenesis protein CcsB